MRLIFAVFFGVAVVTVLPMKEETCPSDMVPTTIGTCIDRYEWPNRKGSHPLLGATGLRTEYDRGRGPVFDATSLCERVGKRVCSREEWLGACRGSRPRSCNTDKRYIGPDEKKVHERDPEEMQRLDQSEPAGAREGCVSKVGAFDMVGNAEEWVTCPGIGDYGWCLMGRYWADRRSCTFTITRHSPRWHFYTTGFRCCVGGSDDAD